MSLTTELLLAPSFALPDHRGGMFALAEGPQATVTVLVFYRGHWCPYCRRYLTKLSANGSRFKERGVRMAAVSPEPMATTQSFARDLDVPFPLLSDVEGQVIARYGTRNGRLGVGNHLPHPAVFIIDTDGAIRFRSIDRNYKKRTTLRTIFRVLDEMKT